MTALMLTIFVPVQLKAVTKNDVAVNSPKAAESAEAETLLNRLEEINTMDKSTLSRPEKRQLRKEVRSINKNLKTINGGVYLSVGAIIVILLLLILLL